MRIPKINSNSYGGRWIGSGIVIGAVIPFLLWLLFHKFYWGFSILGGVILLAFLIIFMIEMHQDSAKIPYYERDLKESIVFRPEEEYPVIRSSICTGEKMAGFKNRKTGHFKEVMLIRSPEDLKRFQKIYELDDIKTEY